MLLPGPLLLLEDPWRLAQAKSGGTVRVPYTGRRVDVSVTDSEEGFVKLDGNHPLPGRDLTFEIEWVKIG